MALPFIEVGNAPAGTGWDSLGGGVLPFIEVGKCLNRQWVVAACRF